MIKIRDKLRFAIKIFSLVGNRAYRTHRTYRTYTFLAVDAEGGFSSAEGGK